MKKLLVFLSAAMLLSLTACKGGPAVEETPTDTPDPTPTVDYLNDGVTELTVGELTITVDNKETDRIYKKSDKEIILISSADVDKGDSAPEFTLTGTFDGKIINKTKGTVLNLTNVTLKNTGAPAIYGEKKFELSAKKSTTNEITVTGTDSGKSAAVYCEKKIELGGGGTLTINSSLYHGVKADEVQIKGSGKLYINGNGTTEGSAINCNTFEVGRDKTVTVTFNDFRHGIKADKTISIESGKFIFKTSITVPMRTDKKEDDGEDGHQIVVTSRDCLTFEGGNEQEAKINTDDLQLPPPADPA